MAWLKSHSVVQSPLPCPCCNGVPAINKSPSRELIVISCFAFECTSQPCAGGRTMGDAVYAWNLLSRRTVPDNERSLLMLLRDVYDRVLLTVRDPGGGSRSIMLTVASFLPAEISERVSAALEEADL